MQDVLKDGGPILRDFIVPEPQHTPTSLSQKFVASCVGRVFRVLAAIEFHNDPVLYARKIGDKRSDWDLSPKLDSLQATVAQ